MATWDEFVSDLGNIFAMQKMGDDAYAIPVKLLDGQDYAVLVRSNIDGTWANITAPIGDVPDEKLNELLMVAMEYAFGALVKVTTTCYVRCPVSVEHLNVDGVSAAILETAFAAAKLKSRFCTE
jgi:hypothetical protein